MLQAMLMMSSFMLTNSESEWYTCKIGWALDWALYILGLVCTMVRRENSRTNTAIIMFIVYLKLYLCIVEAVRVFERIKATREAYVEDQTMKLMVEQQKQAEAKLAKLKQTLEEAQKLASMNSIRAWNPAYG